MTHQSRSFIVFTALASFAAVAHRAQAQHTHDMPMPASSQPSATHDHAAMQHGAAMPDMSAHMRMTSMRPATAADSARAIAVADSLRAAIAKYRDVHVAERDGYKLFLPGVKAQRVFHFTKKWNAMRNSFGFDATRPTSLLYRKNDAGDFVLIGAMYTAPRRLDEKELDARVPLSIAQWHQHVNICVPKPGHRERWLEKRDGQMLFGPAGVISSEAECDKADGRFIPQLFGWMVHANVFAQTDGISAWADDHRMDPSEMQHTSLGPADSATSHHH